MATTGAVAQTSVRLSADPGFYRYDASVADKFKWKWAGSRSRTVYNPLDGGILVQYSIGANEAFGNSDGCSAGDDFWKTTLIEACLAHDANYDAPFKALKYQTSGDSLAKELADYLFLLDMQTAGRGKGPVGAIMPVWFATVGLVGKHRGGKGTASVSGGMIAVKNKGAYKLQCRLKWTDPRGVARQVEDTRDSGQRALVFPLSNGVRNIDIECWAIGGTQIFRKTYPAAGLYGFTVKGSTLIHPFTDVVED